MKIRSIQHYSTLHQVERAWPGLLCLVLLFLLVLGPSIVRALLSLPDRAIPAEPTGSHSSGGQPPVAPVPEGSERLWGPLLNALSDFLFVLGAGVLLLELWRVRRGEAISPLAWLGGVVVVALAIAGRAVFQAACRLWLIPFIIGCFGLSVTAGSAGTTDPSSLGQASGAARLGFVLLAQAAVDPPFEPIISFLGKTMLLVGGIMIFAGGWKIHKGETSEGLLAIAGGFIVAMAFPIIRYFAGLI